MSRQSLDDLARTLAEPMPRRRALRFAGAALVGSVVPGLRPLAALADGCGPDTHCSDACTADGDIGACGTESRNACGQITCRLTGCLHAGEKCCPGPDQPWICNEDDRCGSPNGPHCVSCPEERKCGKTCCKSDEFCASPNRELCCKTGDNGCLVPNSPHGACCRPGTQCCFTKNGGVCCGSDQTCKNGKCVCKEGQTCGEHCCKKGETCSNGRCCPKGRVNCGDGECCKSSASCCGGACCTGRETCVGGAKGKQCCNPSRISGSGASARCCPGGTVATATGCCPPTNLNCCDSLDTSGLACLGPNQVCVRGACKTL